MKNPLILLFWLLICGGVLNYFISGPSYGPKETNVMKEAFVEYTRGETAESVGERREAFNIALKNYQQLETQADLEFGTGKLYYNLANTYFQLGEYPFAVLYYYRAIDLMPRDPRPKNNLTAALEKLGIKKEEVESPFRKILFFYDDLSLPERLQLFFFLSAVALVFASLYIWKERKWMWQAAGVSSVLSALLLLILGYSYYFSPIEAVLVKSTSLYRDAGFHYAKVIEEPLLSGKKVEVVDLKEDGAWLKVIISDGKLGYVPAESLRMI